MSKFTVQIAHGMPGTYIVRPTGTGYSEKSRQAFRMVENLPLGGRVRVFVLMHKTSEDWFLLAEIKDVADGFFIDSSPPDG